MKLPFASILSLIIVQGCATPQDPGQDFLVIRPFQSKSLIRLEARLNADAEARDLAKGETPAARTQLEPNTSYRNGLALGYGGYTLSFSKVAPISEASLQERGSTQASDYQMHGAWGALGFDLYWQEYQGLHDGHRSHSGTGSTNYPYYPKLSLMRRGANLFYINDSRNYKHNAQLQQSEYQKSSGDSLLFVTSFDSLRILHLPDELQERYQEEIAGDRLEALSMSFLVGYAFTLKSVQGPWLAATIFAGRSYQMQSRPAQSLSRDAQMKTANKVITSASLGLDRASWFFGLKFWADSLSVPLDRTEYALNTSIFEFFLGCRL